MIYIVTGLPGAGKTTYVKNRLRSNDIAYDLDYIAQAIVLGKDKTRSSTYIANQLLKPFLELSKNNIEADVYIIRTAPSKEEIELFNSYNSKYLDISVDYNYCYDIRKDSITLEEFNNVYDRYKRYKKDNSIIIETILRNIERW